MEKIEREKLRDFILWLWGIVEKAQADLLAHQVAFNAFFMLKASGQFPELDQLLKKARENPPPELEERHKEGRKAIELILAEENPADSLMTFLQNWKPKGPIQ